MAEEITSPDQRKPINRKPARVGALVVAALLLLMILGNEKGSVGPVFLMIGAGILVLMVLADWLLRKNGLRR